MSPTSPMTVAATIGPTPNSSVTVVFDAVTAGGDPAARLAALGVKTDEVGDELDSEFVAGRGGRPGRFELVEQAGGLSWADLGGDAAGDEVAEHRVEPAGDPVVVPRQIAVTFRPHLHHRGVILAANLRHRR